MAKRTMTTKISQKELKVLRKAKALVLKLGLNVLDPYGKYDEVVDGVIIEAACLCLIRELEEVFPQKTKTEG